MEGSGLKSVRCVGFAEVEGLSKGLGFWVSGCVLGGLVALGVKGLREQTCFFLSCVCAWYLLGSLSH